MPVQLFPSTPSPPPPNGHLLQSLRIIGLAAALIPGMIAVRGATTPPAGAIKLLPDLIQSPRAQKLAFSQQKQLKRLNGGKTRRKRGKPATSHHTSTARPRALTHTHTHTQKEVAALQKKKEKFPLRPKRALQTSPENTKAKRKPRAHSRSRAPGAETGAAEAGAAAAADLPESVNKRGQTVQADRWR